MFADDRSYFSKYTLDSDSKFFLDDLETFDFEDNCSDEENYDDVALDSVFDDENDDLWDDD